MNVSLPAVGSLWRSRYRWTLWVEDGATGIDATVGYVFEGELFTVLEIGRQRFSGRCDVKILTSEGVVGWMDLFWDDVESVERVA